MRTRQMAKDIDEKIEELKEHIHEQFSANNKYFEVKNYLKSLKMNLKRNFQKNLKNVMKKLKNSSLTKRCCRCTF